MTVDSLWNALGELTDIRSTTGDQTLQQVRSFGAEIVDPLGLILKIGEVEARLTAAKTLAEFGSIASANHLIDALQDREQRVRDAAVHSLIQIGTVAVAPLLEAIAKSHVDRSASLSEALRHLKSLDMPEITDALLDQIASRISEERSVNRRALFVTLARIPDSRATDTLVDGLSDIDPTIRISCVDAITARNNIALPALLAALDDDLVFRQHVGASLVANSAQLDSCALAMLFTASRIGKTPVRWVADFVLSQVADASNLHSLDHAINDPDEDVRLIAIQSVRMVTESNIDAILKAVKDTSTPVRRAAIEVLAGVADPRARAAMVQAANDEDPAVRQIALRLVGTMDDISEIEPLVTALSNRDTALRRTAADVLVNQNPDRVVPALVAALKMDPYGDAARTLGRIGDERAVEPLLATLSGATYVLRQASIEALGALADRRALPAFLHAMNDDTSGVREAAVKALDRLGAPESIARLIEALTDAAPSVRERAALALEHMGPLVLQALLPSLESSDWRVRLNTVQILGRVGDVRAVEVLLRKLHDPAGNVCGAVIAELKRLVDARSVGWLLKALEDRDAYVRENVADLMTQLGDSYTLPRLVVAETRLTPRDRASILDYMRRVRYSDRHITFRFTAIGDVVSYCRQIANDTNPEVQAGARAILTFIDQIRAAQPAPITAG